jgi:hypothetical protein
VKLISTFDFSGERGFLLVGAFHQFLCQLFILPTNNRYYREGVDVEKFVFTLER